jgi:hypothetical protein
MRLPSTKQYLLQKSADVDRTRNAAAQALLPDMESISNDQWDP